MKHLVCILLLLNAQKILSQEEHEYQHIEIYGNNIAFSCEGLGKKTVLLIAGMGLDAHSWFQNIYHNYESDDYQICLYDRAGVGASTFSNPRVRSLNELVEELHSLIKKNNWNDITLVAHSFGGFVARGYVDSHPQRVKAVLFADSVGQSWYANMKSNMSKDGWSIMESIIEWEKLKHSREDLVEAIEAAERYSFPKDLPITVLSRGLPYTKIRQAKFSYEDIDVYNTTWDFSQFELLKLSNNSVHVVMRYSDHLIDEKDPWLVLEEIYRLQDRIQ